MVAFQDRKMGRDSWYEFRCRMPAGAFKLLEDELERVRLLADIDPDDNLAEEVRDGLALELIVANSAGTPDESVI